MKPKMTIFINDAPLSVEAGKTVLQACHQANIEIPVFCYHPKLSIAGNCRMCLVELENVQKPIASCATPVSEGMRIHTKTPLVEESRKGNLEFLLINHPLDCPVCDQAGECDLQDITVAYGSATSRFSLNKRVVCDKEMGPLIKTIMTRCIHCTRCVRFATEVAGVPELGTLGRGEDMEITSYLEKALVSELSGNLIDICPVGALTNAPYAFWGRPWDLISVTSVDVMDAVGAPIRLDTYQGKEVMRVLPKIDEEINDGWIHDKTRFSYDGLKYQRLDRPYRRVDGTLMPCSWGEALSCIAQKIETTPGEEIAALSGDLSDVESQFLLKRLMRSLGSPHTDCRQDGMRLEAHRRSRYLFNTGISGIEEADLCWLIGANPRLHAPLINARIRKRYLKGSFTVANLGEHLELTYPYQHLGQDPEVLQEIMEGKHPFCTVLQQAKRPMLVLGKEVLARRDSAKIQEICQEISERYQFQALEEKEKGPWNGYNVLHTAAGRVGGLDVGFVPADKGLDGASILEACRSGRLKVLYLLGADEWDLSDLGKTFVIYQGHHGDAGAHRADVVLPGLAYTEKEATYVNLEGRVQRTQKAIHSPGEAQEDWKVIEGIRRKLIEAKRLPEEDVFHQIEDVWKKLEEENPVFLKRFERPEPLWERFMAPFEENLEKDQPIISSSKNECFYQTDPISRHSLIMAKALQTRKAESPNPSEGQKPS